MNTLHEPWNWATETLTDYTARTGHTVSCLMCGAGAKHATLTEDESWDHVCEMSRTCTVGRKVFVPSGSLPPCRELATGWQIVPGPKRVELCPKHLVEVNAILNEAE